MTIPSISELPADASEGRVFSGPQRLPAQLAERWITKDSRLLPRLRKLAPSTRVTVTTMRLRGLIPSALLLFTLLGRSSSADSGPADGKRAVGRDEKIKELVSSWFTALGGGDQATLLRHMQFPFNAGGIRPGTGYPVCLKYGQKIGKGFWLSNIDEKRVKQVLPCLMDDHFLIREIKRLPAIPFTDEKPDDYIDYIRITTSSRLHKLLRKFQSTIRNLPPSLLVEAYFTDRNGMTATALLLIDLSTLRVRAMYVNSFFEE